VLVPQGVSNIIYGMGLMGAQWHQMGDAYTTAASAAVVAGFGVAVQRRGTVTVVVLFTALTLIKAQRSMKALHHL
jgi:hypothetical protein